MSPETLHARFFFQEKLPTLTLKLEEWRLFWLKAVAVFCLYSTAACEAFVVLSTCGEILLKTALVLTSGVAFHLTIVLKLNAFLRLKLTGVLLSKRGLDGRGCASCSTWLPSRPIRRNSCSEFCRGRRRAVRRLEPVQEALRVLPVICHLWVCVCVSLVHMALSVPSALCRNFRLIVSIVTASWGYIRPLVTILQVMGVACSMWPI